MLRVLRNARIPLFLHRKSNHIFTVWQHIAWLVMIRQYEAKSYRLFVDWLVDWSILSENRSPVITTYTTFHYSSEIHGKNQWNPTRKDNNFIIHNSYKRWQLFIGIDSSGFKATHVSQYYTERAKLTRRRKYISKLSLTADVVQQIICTIKIRRAPTRHDIIFSTTHNKDIRNLTIVSGYRWQRIRMIAKTITY